MSVRLYVKCLRECYWKEENGEYLGCVVVLAGLHFRSTRAQSCSNEDSQEGGKVVFLLKSYLSQPR